LVTSSRTRPSISTFNLSKDGQLDSRGPWNQEPAFKYVDDPTPQGSAPQEVKNADDERRTARAAE